MSGFSETISVEGGLVKFQSILALSHTDEEFVYYAHPQEDETDTYRRGTGYDMTRKDYEELSRPDQITITVEPGDTLNAPDES